VPILVATEYVLAMGSRILICAEAVALVEKQMGTRGLELVKSINYLH
jgi:hypothetical protein